MRRQISLCVWLTCCLTLCFQAKADFVQDFESSTTGDRVSSLWLFGVYGFSTIQPVGVEGTNGFAVNIADSGGISPGLTIPADADFLDVGDAAELSIDLKFKNPEEFGSSGSDPVLMELEVENFYGSQIVAQLVRTNELNDYSEYFLRLFLNESGSNVVVTTDPLPVLDLGLLLNQPGDESNFLTIVLDIERSDDSNFSVGLSLLETSSGQKLAAVRAEEVLLDFSMTWLSADFKVQHYGDFSPSSTAIVASTLFFDNLQLKRTLVSRVAAPVTSLIIANGELTSGDEASLSSIDGDSLVVRRALSSLQARIASEIIMVSPTTEPTRLELKISGRVFSRSNVWRSVDLFNYNTKTWEEVISKNQIPFNYFSSGSNMVEDVERFVDPETGEIRARLRFESDTRRQQISSLVEEFVVIVGI